MNDGLTGELNEIFCTSGSEREFTREERWYADGEIQAGADRLEPTSEHVGKAANGQVLFEVATNPKPDVIVTDISMLILNAVEAANKLKEYGCTSKLVFLDSSL